MLESAQPTMAACLATTTPTSTITDISWDESRKLSSGGTKRWSPDLNENYTRYGGPKMRMKMSKNVRVRVTNDGRNGFFDRARGHARKLDRGEKPPAEMTISFENPSDIMLILSPQRIRVLEFARKGASPVSSLASGLRRDTRAVSRDVELLEQ